MNKHERLISTLTELLEIKRDLDTVKVQLELATQHFQNVWNSHNSIEKRLNNTMKEAKELDENTD